MLQQPEAAAGGRRGHLERCLRGAAPEMLAGRFGFRGAAPGETLNTSRLVFNGPVPLRCPVPASIAHALDETHPLK